MYYVGVNNELGNTGVGIFYWLLGKIKVPVYHFLLSVLKFS